MPSPSPWPRSTRGPAQNGNDPLRPRWLCECPSDREFDCVARQRGFHRGQAGWQASCSHTIGSGAPWQAINVIAVADATMSLNNVRTIRRWHGELDTDHFRRRAIDPARCLESALLPVPLGRRSASRQSLAVSWRSSETARLSEPDLSLSRGESVTARSRGVPMQCNVLVSVAGPSL
jgi:hypothetical protein